MLAATLNVLALRSERPSEVALFMGLTRVAVVVIGVGFLVTIVFGLWLVHEAHFSFGDALGRRLARPLVRLGRARRPRRRARPGRRASSRSGSRPRATLRAPELRARMRDPVTLALSWGSGLAVLAVLALMIWKPGS